ncbi:MULTISPECIES: hypothetical protein [unclassified Pseudomonas]|uniref:hypothetical protein n=1 Tax=unclassified Pseudomonas TaxID=196821 RepID=UPI000C888C79|nr:MULTISPECIES: hypothetical protein [unclassified Pseudomonas]PMZ93122.1 hypothetical protein C1X61_01115 [Pseudomonas sp. FW215-T2]PNA13014.1 hypothetical protein C1X62_11290 [Pseudomonas sp. FW215-R3]PNB36529.1 hypothetical protein C1X63_17245 [Pseudomonas sp. FW305-131]
MYWFRRHRQSLLHLTLVVWVLAVVVMAIQGCLVQPDHNIAAPHHAEQYVVVDDHAQHTSGCLQNCEATATAIKPVLQTPALDPIQWTALLLLTAAVIMVLDPERKSSFAALALKRPAPPEGPVRLTFVRFND